MTKKILLLYFNKIIITKTKIINYLEKEKWEKGIKVQIQKGKN